MAAAMMSPSPTPQDGDSTMGATRAVFSMPEDAATTNVHHQHQHQSDYGDGNSVHNMDNRSVTSSILDPDEAIQYLQEPLTSKQKRKQTHKQGDLNLHDSGYVSTTNTTNQSQMTPTMQNTNRDKTRNGSPTVSFVDGNPSNRKTGSKSSAKQAKQLDQIQLLVTAANPDARNTRPRTGRCRSKSLRRRQRQHRVRGESLEREISQAILETAASDKGNAHFLIDDAVNGGNTSIGISASVNNGFDDAVSAMASTIVATDEVEDAKAIGADFILNDLIMEASKNLMDSSVLKSVTKHAGISPVNTANSMQVLTKQNRPTTNSNTLFNKDVETKDQASTPREESKAAPDLTDTLVQTAQPNVKADPPTAEEEERNAQSKIDDPSSDGSGFSTPNASNISTMNERMSSDAASSAKALARTQPTPETIAEAAPSTTFGDQFDDLQSTFDDMEWQSPATNFFQPFSEPVSAVAAAATAPAQAQATSDDGRVVSNSTGTTTKSNVSQMDDKTTSAGAAPFDGSNECGEIGATTAKSSNAAGEAETSWTDFQSFHFGEASAVPNPFAAFTGYSPATPEPQQTGLPVPAQSKPGRAKTLALARATAASPCMSSKSVNPRVSPSLRRKQRATIAQQHYQRQQHDSAPTQGQGAMESDTDTPLPAPSARSISKHSTENDAAVRSGHSRVGDDWFAVKQPPSPASVADFEPLSVTF